MASTADTPRARQLGAELKALRNAAKMTTTQLGHLLERSHSHISRWENGKLIPTTEDTAAVLAVLGVTGPRRERLLALARDAADPNWVAPGLDRQLAALMEYEKTAVRIVNVEPLMIPGLLQTADYARSIMIGAGATRRDADERVEHRMGRKSAIARKGVEFTAVIGAHALYFPPCPENVMTKQLRHLLTMAERPNITIVALPLECEYSPALEGPFVLLEFEKSKPVVQLEHYRSTTTITDARDVRDYQQAADDILHRDALSPEETLKLVAKLSIGTER